MTRARGRARRSAAGCRSEELTLPGLRPRHLLDRPLPGARLAVPARLPLAEHGLELVHPDAPLAHPLDDGSAVILERSVEETAGSPWIRRAAYRRLFEPLVRDADALCEELLGPLRLPRHPLLMARFGLERRPLGRRAWPARASTGERARALLAGCCAHSMLSLRTPGQRGAFGLVLAVERARGRLAGRPRRLAAARRCAGRRTCARSAARSRPAAGWSRSTSCRRGAPSARRDPAPAPAHSPGDRSPARLPAPAARYRYGPGVFKLDWALDGPIPWRAAGGRRGPARSTSAARWTRSPPPRTRSSAGEHAERPFVLLVQPSLFDPGRAPAGKHTAWAYCHVPNGSTAT